MTACIVFLPGSLWLHFADALGGFLNSEPFLFYTVMLFPFFFSFLLDYTCSNYSLSSWTLTSFLCFAVFLSIFSEPNISWLQEWDTPEPGVQGCLGFSPEPRLFASLPCSSHLWAQAGTVRMPLLAHDGAFGGLSICRARTVPGHAWAAFSEERPCLWNYILKALRCLGPHLFAWKGIKGEKECAGNISRARLSSLAVLPVSTRSVRRLLWTREGLCVTPVSAGC